MNINNIVKTKYAGADWLKKNLAYAKPTASVSELGEIVADIIGQLYEGIYHVEDNHLFKADWANPKRIVLTLPDGGGRFATYDFSLLTHLVLLAQATKIRIAITAATHGYLRLTFSRYDDHRTIEDAIAFFIPSGNS